MARVGAVAALLLCAATAVSAQPLPLELEWNAPPECPTAAAVRAELERIARARPGEQLTPLSARAEVTKAGGAYGVVLHTEHDGQRGERRLQARDCETLVRTVTLVLALAYGAGVEVSGAEAGAGVSAGAGVGEGVGAGAGAGARSESDTKSESDTASDAESESESDTESDSPSPSFGPTAWKLLLGAGAQLGGLPVTALAASAGAELSGTAWSLSLRLTAWPGVSTAVVGDIDARFDGLGAALQGCRLAQAASLELALCAGARAAALRGRAQNSAEDGSATAPWYALSAGVALSWPRDRDLHVRIEANIAPSLDRPEFAIENVGPVHRVPALSGDLGAALVLAL